MSSEMIVDQLLYRLGFQYTEVLRSISAAYDVILQARERWEELRPQDQASMVSARDGLYCLEVIVN
jgi:hypothetical protein